MVSPITIQQSSLISTSSNNEQFCKVVGYIATGSFKGMINVVKHDEKQKEDSSKENTNDGM